MITIPMKSNPPLNKQTILTINQQQIQKAKNSQTILSINLGKPMVAPNTTALQSHIHPTPALSTNNTNSFIPMPATSPTNTTNSTPQPIPSLINPIQKGQKVPLETTKKLSKLQARFGWNISNPACDVDVSAFLLNSNGKVIGDTWFVFYGQKSSPDNSTLFSIAQGQDREIISINFHKINPMISKIVFVLTIHEALEKHLNFRMLKDAYIRIIDQTTNTELVSFKMDEYYSNVTSMMIGELYQYQGTWKFNAIGNGVARDLAGLCELYGVQVV